MRGRSRTGPSAIFDPPHEHLDSCNLRSDTHPSPLGVQALMSTCMDRANGCFYNGCHGVEAACAFSPPGWSRSPPRSSARVILIEPQPSPLAEKFLPKSFCQPNRLGTVSISSHVESNKLGTFLLAAKEGLQWEIYMSEASGRASCAPAALKARQAHSPRGARSSPASGAKATMTGRTLMAVWPSLHGGPGPVVASRVSAG